MIIYRQEEDISIDEDSGIHIPHFPTNNTVFYFSKSELWKPLNTAFSKYIPTANRKLPGMVVWMLGPREKGGMF